MASTGNSEIASVVTIILIHEPLQCSDEKCENLALLEILPFETLWEVPGVRVHRTPGFAPSDSNVRHFEWIVRERRLGGNPVDTYMREVGNGEA